MQFNWFVRSISLAAVLSVSSGAHAIIASPGGGVSLLSVPIAPVGVGAGVGGMILSDGWMGTLASYLVTVGSGTVLVLDPPAATYHKGQFTIHYDSTLLQPTLSGWLGDWGNDGTLPNLPADRDAWAAGMPFTIQASAASLSTSTTVDPLLGELSVGFDWGPTGHTAELDHFNFYASVMEAKRNVLVSYLGSSSTALAGANLYVTSSGVTCSLPGDDKIQLCGEPKTDWYRVTEVPEPSPLGLAGAGFIVLAALCGRSRRAR